MFDKLTDLIVAFAGLFRCFIVVDQWEQGVVLRWGRLTRAIGPGLRWHWPLAERALTVVTVPTTDKAPTQSFTLPDGRTLAVTLTVTWHVRDAETNLLRIADSKGVLSDCIAGALADTIQTADNGDLQDPTRLARKVKRLANIRGRQWGISVSRVAFVDYVEAPTYRLIGSPVTYDE